MAKRQHLLCQLQLSNYDREGKFILEADSGAQMVMGRVRVMLALNPDLHVTVMTPVDETCKTPPQEVYGDLWASYGPSGDRRLRFVPVQIMRNALATRYDFSIEAYRDVLRDSNYDAVYINDPMLLRHFRALFHLYAGYMPRFYVHSHFVDNKESPKFPVEASLWLGQCEAALKADYNFWQCSSTLQVFMDSMAKMFREDACWEVYGKSAPWDDGYSAEEIEGVDDAYDEELITTLNSDAVRGKFTIFVPNRIGGEGRSSDYTNCGHFLFKVIPELWKQRQDFVVIAGNPSQKFSNEEVATRVGPAYLNLFPGGVPTREQYRTLLSHVDIAVGLYNVDTYGGTAAREAVHCGATPLWLDNYEYSRLSAGTGFERYLAKPDLSDLVQKTSQLLDDYEKPDLDISLKLIHGRVLNNCAVENTTRRAMEIMGLL